MITSEDRFKIFRTAIGSTYVLGLSDNLYPVEWSAPERYRLVYDSVIECKYCSDSGINYPPVIEGFNKEVVRRCRLCNKSLEAEIYVKSESMEVCIRRAIE